MENMKIGNFNMISNYELLSINGGINWWHVAESAAIGAVGCAAGGAIGGAGAGTVVCPVIGTVSVSVAAGVIGGVVGAVGGATKSIIQQEMN